MEEGRDDDNEPQRKRMTMKRQRRSRSRKKSEEGSDGITKGIRREGGRENEEKVKGEADWTRQNVLYR